MNKEKKLETIRETPNQKLKQKPKKKWMKKAEEPEKKKTWRHRRQICVLFTTSSTWSSFLSWNSLTSHCSQTLFPDSGLPKIKTQLNTDKGSVSGNNESLQNIIRRNRIRRRRWRRGYHFFLSVSFAFLIFSFSFWLSVFFIDFLKTQHSQGCFYKLLCYSLIISVSECVSNPFLQIF